MSKNKKIVVSRLSRGIALGAGEETGFGSLSTNTLLMPNLAEDKRIISLIEDYNAKIEELLETEYVNELESGEDLAQEMINKRQQVFSDQIRQWYPMADTKDIDWAEIVEIPEGMKYALRQGFSGIEEVIIYNGDNIYILR